MDLTVSAQDLAFREEMREFISENYPTYLREKIKSGKFFLKEDFLAWHRVLFEAGMIAPAWPKEYGGTGWTPAQRFIFKEELNAAGVVDILAFGIGMLGPVLLQYGSEEQKQHFLPRILSGEDWWCQGYSEPGAGSDLASLRTRAVRDGDEYVVDGSKTWTTFAHYADWIFCLVRTSTEGKKQQGISFLLIDMKTPGITIRPIRGSDGEHHLNEVFFDGVRVPAKNMVGEENMGWTYAKALLSHERGGIAEISRSKEGIKKLKKIAKSELSDGRPLLESELFSRKVAELEIDLLALEFTELRAVDDSVKGTGAEASILKLCGSEIHQRISELRLDAVGYYGFPFIYGPKGIETGEFSVGPQYARFAGSAYVGSRAATLYGGSSEIQRGIVAKHVLGL